METSSHHHGKPGSGVTSSHDSAPLPHRVNGSDPDLVDTRDMVVVHTAMLREFRLAPALVTSVREHDRPRVRQVDAHLQLICDLMHHHHTGEDELLWPVLAPRLTHAETTCVAAAEAQHAGLDAALSAVTSARTAWIASPGESSRDALATALSQLHTLLSEHLEFEERNLLPLAAAHLSHTEWHAIGEAGARSVSKRQMPLVLGMFAYEGDPAVLATMLAGAPAPVRALLPRLAARSYARYARSLYGTGRP